LSTPPKKKRAKGTRQGTKRARARAKHAAEVPAEAEAPPVQEEASPPEAVAQESVLAPEPMVENVPAAPVGVLPSRRSAYARLLVLGVSFLVAVYLGLEAATLFVRFNFTLPISTFLTTQAHLSNSVAAYSLLGILVVEIILVQIWAWRTRRLSGLAFEEEGPALETPRMEEPQPPAAVPEQAPAEEPLPVEVPIETVQPEPVPPVVTEVAPPLSRLR